MPPRESGVLGVFADPGAAAAAARRAVAEGFLDLRAALPAPFPEVMEALGRPQSRIGWITLIGALVGTAAGFALTIGTSLALPVITGGKEVASIPPFVVIAFETTILFGALSNLVAMSVAATLGRSQRPVPSDPRFSDDRVGIYVVGGDPRRAEAILTEAGAEEVRRVG